MKQPHLTQAMHSRQLEIARALDVNNTLLETKARCGVIVSPSRRVAEAPRRVNSANHAHPNIPLKKHAPGARVTRQLTAPHLLLPYTPRTKIEQQKSDSRVEIPRTCPPWHPKPLGRGRSGLNLPQINR